MDSHTLPVARACDALHAPDAIVTISSTLSLQHSAHVHYLMLSAITHVARAGYSAAQSHATRAKFSHARAWRARCDIGRAMAHTGAWLHARTPGESARAGAQQAPGSPAQRSCNRARTAVEAAEWAPAEWASRVGARTRGAARKLVHAV